MISVKKEVKKRNKKKKNLIKQIKRKFSKIKKQTTKKINKLKKINIKKEVHKTITKLKNINYKKEIKTIILKLKAFIKKYYYVILMSIPFILIDIITRLLGNKVDFYGIIRLVPNLFTIEWILLVICICLSLKNRKGIKKLRL